MKPYQPSARDLKIYEACSEGGESQQEVAKRFKISQQRVSQICRRVDQYLAPQLAGQVFELKARHTRQLESVFRRAIQGFEKSQEPVVSETVTGGEEGTTVTKTTRGQSGNPAFLAQARGALDDIRRIWGANEPELVVEGVAGMATGGMSRHEVLTEYEKRFNTLIKRIRESTEN